MAIDFKNRLKGMSEAWKTGKDKAPGVDDGVYYLQLQKAELKESQKHNLMIARTHVVIDGAFTGETITDFLMVDNNNGLYYVAQWMKSLGYEPLEDISGLEDFCAQLTNENPCYNGQVKKSRDSDLRNVTIKELIEASGETKPAVKPSPKPKTAPVTESVETETQEETSTDEIAEGTAVTFEYEGNIIAGTVTGPATDNPEEFIVDDGNGGVYQLARGDFSVVTSEGTTPEEVTTEAAGEHDDKQAELLAFCQAKDIEVSDDEAASELVTKINQYEYKKDELTAEELALLEAIGATFTKPEIKKPTPKPAVAKPIPATVVKAPEVKKPVTTPQKPALAPAPVVKKPEVKKPILKKK